MARPPATNLFRRKAAPAEEYVGFAQFDANHKFEADERLTSKKCKLQRNRRLTKEEIMMDRREMIREYKRTLLPMGIVQVKNINSGRVYITASANTTGTINRIRFQLKMGAFLPSPALVRDWKELGEQGFLIEVLDELQPVDDPDHDYQDDLKTLEMIWLEKLKPYG